MLRLLPTVLETEPPSLHPYKLLLGSQCRLNRGGFLIAQGRRPRGKRENQQEGGKITDIFCHIRSWPRANHLSPFLFNRPLPQTEKWTLTSIHPSLQENLWKSRAQSEATGFDTECNIPAGHSSNTSMVFNTLLPLLQPILSSAPPCRNMFWVLFAPLCSTEKRGIHHAPDNSSQNLELLHQKPSQRRERNFHLPPPHDQTGASAHTDLSL